jgi:hypothetical protein
VDTERISSLINELDKQVPKDGAIVEAKQYGGGPDESKITANRAGYLRLGIEFLKAGFSETSDKDKKQLSTDIRYLFTDDSDVCFDWFERVEDFQKQKNLKASFWKRVAGKLIAAAVLLVLIFALIGMFYLASRLFNF